MKKFIIKFPANKADEVGTWLYENKVQVMLSYSSGDFFGNEVTVICAVPDETVAAFQEKYKSQIKS